MACLLRHTPVYTQVSYDDVISRFSGVLWDREVIAAVVFIEEVDHAMKRFRELRESEG